jgi:hypothetical protein
MVTETSLDEAPSEYVLNLDSSDSRSFLEVRIKYTTTITQKSITGEHEHIITKFGESNAFFIYSDMPTVAYRKNCIGINTSSPELIAENSGVLVISPSSNRDRICF